jgi:hypothetical protein
MRGGWELDGATWIYVVYSCDTMIAMYNPETGKRLVTRRQHSTTTTFHQELCRAWVPGHELL